MKKKSAPNVKI